MTETTKTSDIHQDIGTSPTMTNIGVPLPLTREQAATPISEDVWQAILRLEAKRVRQADLIDEGCSVPVVLFDPLP